MDFAFWIAGLLRNLRWSKLQILDSEFGGYVKDLNGSVSLNSESAILLDHGEYCVRGSQISSSPTVYNEANMMGLLFVLYFDL